MKVKIVYEINIFVNNPPTTIFANFKKQKFFQFILFPFFVFTVYVFFVLNGYFTSNRLQLFFVVSVHGKYLILSEKKIENWFWKISHITFWKVVLFYVRGLGKIIRYNHIFFMSFWAVNGQTGKWMWKTFS